VADDSPSTGEFSSSTAAVRVPNRWLALVVLSLAQLMDIVDNTIVNIALPTAQRELGFSIADRQWVITGYALAFGSLLLIGGRLSDLFGRKRMFMIGVGGFALASAIGGAATGFELLLIARVAQGAFAAMLAPAALSLLSVTFSDNPQDRGKAFGVFGAISGAGGAIGLLLGGFLTESLSWRWCLYVNLIFAVLAFLGAIVFLRGGTRPARVRFDVAGAVTAVLGLAGIVYGLGNAAGHGWTAPVTRIPTVTGVVLLAVFVIIERRVEHPLLPVRVVLDRVRGASYLTLGIAGTGTFAIFLFLTYYLQQTLGFSPILTGVAFLPMIGAVMVGAVVSGTVLMPRTGPRPLVPVGAILAAIGLALLTRIGTDTSYAGTVLPSLVVMGLGFGLIFGPVQNAATSGVTDSDAGIASAMVNTSQQIGGAIGTAVFSSLATLAATSYLTAHGASHVAAATITSYHLVFWVAAAIFAAAAVIAALLFRSGPIPASPAGQTTPTH
jgi:EmrB/QacA subfamily drug resistance transporter